MNEAKEIKDETTEVGLTTATLAGADARPEVRTVAASRLSVGGASSAGAATAPALDEQAAPLFSPEEAKDFRDGGMPSKWVLLTSLDRQCSRLTVSSQVR